MVRYIIGMSLSAIPNQAEMVLAASVGTVYDACRPNVENNSNLFGIAMCMVGKTAINLFGIDYSSSNGHSR